MTKLQGYTQATVDILNSKLGQSITQAFTAGEEHERERIIKLLEEIVVGWRLCDLHNQADTFDYAIALIKGETE